jgi:hypothetical protein
MSKIIVPLHFAKLTTTPGDVAIGFKKFYLKGEWFKLFNGISEIDVVLDRPLDNYTPIPGIITASDTVLTAIEKLDYALNNFTPTVLWGNIGGALSAQTDLMTYLSGNFYPLLTNPAGYLTLATLPPTITPTLQQVVTQGRLYNEVGSFNQYDFEVFSGTDGIATSKTLFSRIRNTANTIISTFSFSRSSFNVKVSNSATVNSEINLMGAGTAELKNANASGNTILGLSPRGTSGNVTIRPNTSLKAGTYDLGLSRIDVSGNITADINVDYFITNVGLPIFTDPTPPFSGNRNTYTVYCALGGAVIGGVTYNKGDLIYRTYDIGLGTWYTKVITEIPNLQEVTDVGSVTTNTISALGFSSNDGFGNSFSLSGAYFDMYDSTGAYFTNFGSASSLFLADVSGNSFSVNANVIDLVNPLGTNINISSSGMVLYDNILNNAWTLNYPAKPNGYVGTFAMLDDVPADQDLQSVTNLGNETTNTLVSKDTVIGPSYRATLSKDGLYILQGSNFTRLYNATLFQNSELEFNSGDGRSVTLGVESAGLSRVTDFKLPNKPTGTYVLATVNDSLLTEFTFDSYIGVRLKPTNVLGNGFYFERNANESVGYSAVNTNTGNGAVALNGVGIDTNPYIKNISITKFGPNYYVPLLANKGGVIGTEEVFIGSRDGNDVSILTGADITTLSRKFTVKANGQLQIQTTPTTGTTSDKLLVRDASGNVKQIDYPTGGGISHTTALGTDTYTATVTGVVAYADGDVYLVRFTNGNTTGCTLNINGLGAIPLFRNNDGPLLGGDILDGGEMLCIYNSTLVEFQVIGISPNSLIAYVTNADSVTITKGMPVYAFSGQGDRMTVKRAFNTSDATSAQTVGLVLSTSIAAGQKGIIMMQGLLDGLSILPTATFADGDPIYLGSTAGTITNVKPYAPNHLVYLGVVTTASNGSAGRMYVRVQNGYELDELHNVQAQSPTLKDTLWYDNTVTPAQWKTASIPTVLGYTPQSTQDYTNNFLLGGM